MAHTFPHLNPAYESERQRATAELMEKYPGQLVAFVDTWHGLTLDRVVVAASSEPQGFQDQLRALDPEVRRRVQMTQVPNPAVVECPSVSFDA